MSVAVILRAVAAAAALAAVVDPACTVTRAAAPGVIVRAGSRGEPSASLANGLRQRLAAALPDRIELDPPDAPAAIVLAAPVADVTGLPNGIPISIVNSDDGQHDVRVARVAMPPVALVGMTFTIAATIEAAGAAGKTTRIVLQHEGVPLDRLEHTWTSDDEAVEARFVHAPPAAGARTLRIAAEPLDGEAVTADNDADVRVMVHDRRLRILMYEPRPSWTTAFMRRVLEEEPLFEIASLARPSRGIAVRTGEAPDRLRLQTLEPFDTVVVGAPEDLRQDEVEALSGFARRRGGTFVLAPDRRPSGAYLTLVPAASFEERLLETPVAISGGAGILRSSELAVPVRPAASLDALASFEGTGGDRVPVVLGWPLGAGRGIFSGALDAWRHRERAGEFAAFWRAQLAAAALASPPAVAVAIEPGIAAPGDPIALTVRVRPTEARQEGRSMAFPEVAARLTRPDGSAAPIRVWPGAEAGVFDGRFNAPEPGTYVVRASVPGATFETALVVSERARAARPAVRRSAGLLPPATGGVTVSADDLSPLVKHLEALAAEPAARKVHPTRSPWWMAGFVALVGAEWALRRTRGGR